MLGHDGDLVAVHTEDLALQVDKLTLTHLHIVPRLEVVLPFLPCRGRHRADLWAAHQGPLAPPWSKLQICVHTCALSHHLQVNALQLILKLLQLRKCGLYTLCDLTTPRDKEKWTKVSDTAQLSGLKKQNYSPRDTPDLRITQGCRRESLASLLPTAISMTHFRTLTTADMAKLLNRKPFRL